MSASGRIAVVRRFGPPEVISIEEHASPDLERGQVRVAVRTGGLNPVDARRRAGTFGGSVPMLLGTEFAGVVVDSADSNWGAGDEVIGWGANGADADLVVAHGAQLLAKPAHIDWQLAGGISGVGQSASTTLDRLALAPGELLVVHGAAGGVGTVLVQLAIAADIDVIGTASDRNHAHLRELGAIPVAYGPGLAERLTDAAAGRRVSASVDLAGTPEAGDFSASVSRAGGTGVTLVPETMMSHRLELVRTQPSPARLAALLAAVERGEVQLPVQSLPFTEIVEAHRRLGAKRATGKLVLDLSDNPHLPATAKDA